MSLKTTKAVFSASERKYRWRRSSTLGWYSRVTKVGTKRLIHGLAMQTQFCVSFIAPWWRKGSFQRTQSFQFLNRSLLRSSPVVMNLRWRLKEYCQKNKQQRWDICKEFSVWHFVTEHRYEIRKALDVKPLLWIERFQLCQFSYISRFFQERMANWVLQATVHPRESGQEVAHGPGGVTTTPTLLSPVLM